MIGGTGTTGGVGGMKRTTVRGKGRHGPNEDLSGVGPPAGHEPFDGGGFYSDSGRIVIGRITFPRGRSDPRLPP